MAPLPASFMLLSILGLLISGTYMLFGRLPLSWGTAFLLVFAIMFIASVLAITPRPERPEPSMAAMRPVAKVAVRRPKRAAPKRRRAVRKPRKRRR